MGTKSKILYYSCLLVNIACFILDFLPIDFEFFRISFPVTLVAIGIWLVVRAFSLKIDSSMFFGITLFICGILNFMLFLLDKYAGMKLYTQFWPYYLFAVAVASLLTGLYFKDKLQFKLFILFLGFGLITLLFAQGLIVMPWMIVLLVVWFVLYFVFNICKSKRSK